MIDETHRIVYNVIGGLLYKQIYYERKVHMAGLKRTDNKGRILKDGEFQRKNGTYRYRYVDADGKRRDIYSNRLVPTDKTPKNCVEELSLREKEKLVNRDLFDGIKARVENKATLNDLFDLYMSGKTKLKESTRTNYLYMYNRFVRESIGKKKIAAIKYSDIKAFYNQLINEHGLKPNSMEIIHTLLHPTFRLAVRDNYIRVNPTSEVMSEIKQEHDWKKPKRISLTIDEQQALITFISNSPTYNRWLPIITVLLGTGCRVGEVIGLRWEDCDFDNMTISINHNTIYRKYKGEQNARFHITTPKTDAGTRTIPMLSNVKDALDQEYEYQQIFGINENVIDGYSGFIFRNRYGEMQSGHNINRAIERIYKAYNEEERAKAAKERRRPKLIRHFSVHNLRHTFCTRLCENESNLKVIQEIMGHADIETTLEIYAEVTERKKKEAFVSLEGKIFTS